METSEKDASNKERLKSAKNNQKFRKKRRLKMKEMCQIVLLPILVSLIGMAECFNGRGQYYRVRPGNVDVAIGGTAVIPCEVGNRAGRVQWTKDGLTLGKTQ